MKIKCIRKNEFFNEACILTHTTFQYLSLFRPSIQPPPGNSAGHPVSPTASHNRKNIDSCCPKKIFSGVFCPPIWYFALVGCFCFGGYNAYSEYFDPAAYSRGSGGSASHCWMVKKFAPNFESFFKRGPSSLTSDHPSRCARGLQPFDATKPTNPNNGGGPPRSMLPQGGMSQIFAAKFLPKPQLSSLT